MTVDKNNINNKINNFFITVLNQIKQVANYKLNKRMSVDLIRNTYDEDLRQQKKKINAVIDVTYQ